MAPRGKKIDAETETAEAAAQPAETSAPAGDQSTAPADTGDAAPVDEKDPTAGDVVAADAVTGGSDASSLTEASTADLAAEASTAAASVLGTIIAEAGAAEIAPAVIGLDRSAPERRHFVVIDPVSLDGQDYAFGDDIAVTRDVHADLQKAGVIGLHWEDGE